MTEWNLSAMRFAELPYNNRNFVYPEKDVKEFIRRLRELCLDIAKDGKPLKYKWFIAHLERLAGERLSK